MPLLIRRPGINLSPLRTKDGGVGGILAIPVIYGVDGAPGHFWVMQISPQHKSPGPSYRRFPAELIPPAARRRAESVSAPGVARVEMKVALVQIRGNDEAAWMR